MRTAALQVLSPQEVETIHNSSMQILQEVGIKVEFPFARQLLAEAGARVDEERETVYFPEKVLLDAVKQAPADFQLCGRDAAVFSMTVGGDQVQFAGLGTPTRIIDNATGEIRPTTARDMHNHIVLVDACKYIHNTQMDVWPNDISMTTIHTEAIYDWAHDSKKSFGLGCYGYLPTLDMMRMMAIAVGGKAELRKKPRFMAICSVLSPLQMATIQIEGLLICADYGQPAAVSPEAIAGATAPVTLAGLLAQENAAILAHIALAQIFRPGAPVLYGTVSTIANMRHGTVALGSIETGLITAGSVQLAQYYGLPTRSVGGTTEAKVEDVQAGMERTQTLMPAVLAGVNMITCAGTLDGSMIESDAQLLLDDELCGSMLRMKRGIEVNEDTLALDLIRKNGYWGNYLAEEHTAQNFRKEHYIPSLFVRDPFESWQEKGSRNALALAREKVDKILAGHQPQVLDEDVEKGLQEYREMVANRSMEEFYAGEDPAYQDYTNL